MGVISVESTSLACLGAECDRLAGSVIPAASAVKGGFVATSAAVRALHSEVDGAARRIASRLRTTGETVSDAGRHFASTEAINEDLLYEV